MFGKFGIECGKFLLIFWQIIFKENGIDGALGHTERAIDTFLGINDKKIGPLVETVYRADLHAIGVFTFDAVFCNDVSHVALPLFIILLGRIRLSVEHGILMGNFNVCEPLVN